MEIDYEYLDKFEAKVQNELLKLCTSYGMLDRVLLATDDIDDLWHEMAPAYVTDAVREIQNYPEVAVSWAMYLGMAVAYGWDNDWEKCKSTPYTDYYGDQGFDNIDDHIVRDILGYPLLGTEAQEITEMVRRCGQTAVSLIRFEHIEPSTPMAFHAFARVIKTMFRTGAALQMKRMGYKFEKVDMPNNMYS